MATLFQRRGVWWINYRVDGQRFRKSIGTTDKKLARVKLDDLNVKIFKGEIGAWEPEIKPARTAEFLHRYESYICKNDGIDRHSDNSRLRAWGRFFIERKIEYLQNISPSVVDSFGTEVLVDCKPKTIRNYLALLKTALNKAVEWDLIESNPITDVSLPRVVKTFHFFTEEEVQRLLQEADEPLCTGIKILVSTGLRRGELFHLRCRDVDLKNRNLRVWPYDNHTPKGKRPRTIPLTDELREIIRDLTYAGSQDVYVFRPFVSDNRLYKRFSALLKMLDMRGTLHDLRHTFASHLAMEGIPIPVIKELLGHSSISTTMIYAHLAPGIHRTAINKLKF